MAAEFAGRIALVTGAARGIGRATAELLAARGARVVAADLDAVEAAGHGFEAAFQVDLADADGVDALIAAVQAGVGRIDVLVNAAGIFPYAAALDTTDALLAQVIAVNLFGTFRLCRAVARPMLEGDGGAIVNIASGTAFRPVPGLAAYAASKGAVVALSRVLALELAPKVRVNVVAPGPTDTEGARAVARDAAGGRAAVEAAYAAPLGGRAAAADVAEAVAYLASPRARFVTGQTLHVNGGRFMP